MPIPNLIRKIRESRETYESEDELYERLLIPEYAVFGWTLEPFDYEAVVSEGGKYYIETRLVEPSKLKCIVRGCERRMFALDMNGKIFSTCPDHRITNGALLRDIFPLIRRRRISPAEAIEKCRELGHDLPVGIRQPTSLGGSVFENVKPRF